MAPIKLAKRMRPLTQIRSKSITTVYRLESAIYLLIAFLLAFMALESLYVTVKSLWIVPSGTSLSDHLVSALNGVLFVIILLELLGTVINHLREGGFQLRPFLIIGIVSSVRRILVLGAQLSTSRSLAVTGPVERALLELAVDAVVILTLSFALYIYSKTKRPKFTARRSTQSADPR